jgi:hypothetical protein
MLLATKISEVPDFLDWDHNHDSRGFSPISRFPKAICILFCFFPVLFFQIYLILYYAEYLVGVAASRLIDFDLMDARFYSDIVLPIGRIV